MTRSDWLAKVGEQIAGPALDGYAAEQTAPLQAQIDEQAAEIADLTAQLAALTAPPKPTPPLAKYPTLFWADEFDGTRVDESRWTVRDGHVGGNEASICWARNVSVADSCLVIQPKREKSTASTKDGPVTRDYTSGYLDSQGKLAVPKNSYVEALLSLPCKPGVSQGLWPAFWLRTLAALLEVDVMEAFNIGAGATADAQKYVPDGRYTVSLWPNTSTPSNGVKGYATPAKVDLTGWHSYGFSQDVEGDATVVQFWFDHAPVTFTYQGKTYSRVSSRDFGWLNWDAVKDKMEIRLNLQIGQPSYYGLPTEQTDFTQTYRVDHVRVWTA